MDHTAINLFDLIVFGTIGLSALLSFFRGFVREVLSLGAWVGAAIITLYAFPHVAGMLKPHVNSTMVASGFAGLFTFMGSLIILSVFCSLFLKFVKSGSEIGLLDNGMGMLFGVLRGVLLVAVGWFLFSLAVAKKDYPDWMAGAITLPYVEKTSEWLARFAPSYLDEVAPGRGADAVEEAVEKAQEKREEKREDAEPSTRWPTMEDLQREMNEVTGGGY